MKKVFAAKAVSPHYPAIEFSRGSLTQCRASIIEAIKETKQQNSRHTLHASRAVSTMQADDFVNLTIGKNGYHVIGCYTIQEVTAK